MKSIRILLAAMLVALLLMAGSVAIATQEAIITLSAADFPVAQDGFYSTMEEVAVYLDTFGCLPKNYLTKKEAESLGWSSRAGNLWQSAPGCSIGGDHFGNYEGNLVAPGGKKHQWTECDIDFDGGHRNAKRVIFSKDGLIYYTEDHYQTFTQILVTQGPLPEATHSSADKR